MDKRTITFILFISLAFFGINFYFNGQRDKKQQELFQQNQQKLAQESTLLREEATKKTASLESLPLVSLSKDPEGKEVVAKGVHVAGSTLTMVWELPLPTTLYVKGQPQTLQTQAGVVGGPVLYADPSFKNFEIVALPPSGTFEVQLISFPAKGDPTVTFARYSDGTIHTAYPLTSNAIALYNTSNGYLPLGYYDASGNLFIEMQNLPLLSNYVQTSPKTQVVKEGDQKYYVIENEYLQLVFTNVGGSLAEINLPFDSSSHPKSVVKEIGFDREIAKDASANAYFPAHPYFTPGSKTEETPHQIGGYYPLLRRGIFGKKDLTIPPQYYGLNLVSDYPELAELVYEVKSFTKEGIVFEATQAFRKITKTYSFTKENAPYCFNLDIKVDGDSRGLWITSGIPEVELMSNSSTPQIQYRMTRKGKVDVEKLDLPKPKEVITASSITPDWTVTSNGYLGVILDPAGGFQGGFRASAIPGEVVPTRLSVIDPEYNVYPASKYPGYEVLAPFPQKAASQKMRIYAGPFEEDVLKQVDQIYSDKTTGYNPNYLACRTFYGWFSFISEPFAKFLFIVMRFFYILTSSWAAAIILLTVFLRVLLYPLNAWSIKSMRRMQLVAPQVQAIQQKYKKDPKRAQMEVMTLYREKKVNPLTGCLPILIQIPFLIGMFDLLKSSFQLRGASFIPGWIDNLTAPDVLFQWKQPIFFIGNQFHLLPVLLGVTMFFQQKLSATAPKDPAQMTDQQRQQRAMGTIMTVVFTVMFYHFPSGLNLYWLSSMLLGIGQQWITNRFMDRKSKHESKIIEVKVKRFSSKKTKN